VPRFAPAIIRIISFYRFAVSDDDFVVRACGDVPLQLMGDHGRQRQRLNLNLNLNGAGARRHVAARLMFPAFGG
jgi:hypothetical protein